MEVKHGIWVGKFESSGSKEQVRIVPNINSLRNIKVGDIFTACLGVKDTYELSGDSHMMKNTEWGVCAYLAESKYGRNGTEIAVNNSNYTIGEGNYISKVLQSTTGNIYGIYDMNGTSWEYMASVFSSKLSNGSNYDFRNINSKYYSTYTNYNESKKIKGDGVYETSTGSSSTSSGSSNASCWHQDHSVYINSSYPVFVRGR